MMKHMTKLAAILLCGLLLCACGTEEQQPPLEPETPTVTTSAKEPEDKTVKTTAQTTAETAARTEGTDMPKPLYYEYDEEDGNQYVYYQLILVAVHSNAEEVTVKTTDQPIYFRVGNLFGGILRTEVSQLPNCRELTFAEGIEDIYWCDHYVDAPNLEILRFPASADMIFLMPDSNLIPESEAIWRDACIPYDPTLVALGSTVPISEEFKSEESFYNTQRLGICYGSFVTRDTLTHIEIAEGNPAYYDLDGVLFTKSRWRYYEYHMFYASAFTERPTAILVCFPQSHPAKDGSYAVPEGTQAILSGAIYHPKYVDTLTLPDSLLYLSPTAIIATAEQPIKIICSRNSAAAEYVERYGEMYYLTVEYRDLEVSSDG